MTPTFYTAHAGRLLVYRWVFFSISVIGVALVLAFLIIPSTPLLLVAGVIAGPFIGVPWALLCMCTWFHPQRGRLQFNSKLSGWLPRWFQSGVRWYAAISLTAFFFIGAVIFPILALCWLNNA